MPRDIHPLPRRSLSASGSCVLLSPPVIRSTSLRLRVIHISLLKIGAVLGNAFSNPLREKGADLSACPEPQVGAVLVGGIAAFRADAFLHALQRHWVRVPLRGHLPSTPRLLNIFTIANFCIGYTFGHEIANLSVQHFSDSTH